MNVEKVIKDNEGLIYKIAKRFQGTDLEDLYQVGVIGILKALNNYVDNSNTKFSTYAYDYIFGEMYYYVNTNRSLKVSRDILKLSKQVETTRYMLAQKLSYIPSNDEVALYLEIPLEVVERAVLSVNSVMSFDNDNEVNMYEVIPSNEVNMLDKLMIDESFKVLSDVEQDIIKSRYYEDLTQSEIALKQGMTQVMVSRYEANAKIKMKNFMTQ